MKRAFIFDMDGVIIDSEPIHFEIDIKTLNYFGAKISKEQLEKYVGMTNPEMWAMIKQEYKLTQPLSEIIEYQLTSKIDIIKKLDIEPIDGIREIILEIKNYNMPIGIASSSPRLLIEEVLVKFDIKKYFDVIVSAEEVKEGKPAPDVYLEAAKLLGVRPNNCIVIEDSKNGITSAKKAGMKCIGYVNKNSGNQDLSEADITVASIRDIRIIFTGEQDQ